MKYDIFISYSRKDFWDDNKNVIPGNIVSQIIQALDNYKQFYDFEYFFDQEDLMCSQDYLDKISNAIAESKVIFFIASENSYNSDFCVKELNFADRRHINIHQYCIDDAKMPNAIEMLLCTHQYCEHKMTSIEKIVCEVLNDALQQEVRLLSDLNGCTTTIKESYQVGDLYDDGKKQGVVFEVSDDGKHGKIISLLESRSLLKWSSNDSEQKRLVGAFDECNGATNMAKIKLIDNWQEKYPAFAWCANLGEDWYLPSKEELRQISTNRILIEKNLIDKLVLFFYWSSTEDNTPNKYKFGAWQIGLYRSLSRVCDKGTELYVRAVTTFDL